jgi:hypothetical protein
MARPPCPACGDNFSVAGVRSLYRSRSLMRSHGKDGGLASAQILAPPPLTRVSGRWVCVAAGMGGLLCLITGFTLVWLWLGLCMGVLLEVFGTWERAQRQDAHRAAVADWQAAYYCTTHDMVFAPGAIEPCAPEHFAALLRSTAVAVHGTFDVLAAQGWVGEPAGGTPQPATTVAPSLNQ